MLKKTRKNLKFSAVSSIFLVSCGGGGGTEPLSVGEESQVNRAPSITVDNYIEVEENSRLIGSFVIEDEDLDEVSMSLEGIDATDIFIVSDSLLSFVESVDFEQPSDLNQDNVYEVRIVGSDGQNKTEVEISIEVVDLAENKWDQSKIDENLLE